MSDSIFPMPLTPFERFFLYRHTPEYPNLMYVSFTFRGQMDRELAAEATDIMLTRHPLMAAQVEQRSMGKFVWVESNNREKAFQWIDGEDTTSFLPALDITSEPGIRIKIINHGDRCDLLYIVHHVATDGIGGTIAFLDWMIIYANLCNKKAPLKGLPRLDPPLLKRRGQLGVFKTSFLKTLPFQWIALYGAGNFILNKVTPLIPLDTPPEPASLTDDRNQLVIRQLSEEIAGAVKTTSEKLGATNNDVLVGLLFLAGRRWRERRGLTTEKDRYRIIVPANIRDIGDRRLPSTNRVTLHYLDRTDSALADRADLIKGIRYELGVISRFQLEKTFLMYLNAISLAPGMLKRTSTQETCQGTMLITNLGEPLRRMKLPREDGKLVVGNVILERFDLIPPIYKRTPVSIAVGRYADVTTLVMRFDPHVMNHSDAEELMNDLVDCIAESAK